MKNKFGLMAGLTLALYGGLPPMFPEQSGVQINAGGGQKELEAYYRKKGLKRFIIGDKEVWARDRKNAERKAKLKK